MRRKRGKKEEGKRSGGGKINQSTTQKELKGKVRVLGHK